jgi:D-arginine dehydrogenase
MEIIETDIVVVGAGIAGASAAAHLAGPRRVLLLEMEATAGYHSTGRSAAVWIQNYGPPDVRDLTGASRGFFESPPAGFAEAKLMAQRPCLFLAPGDQSGALDDMLADARGLAEIAVADARRMVPVLRDGYAARAAIEADAFDMDVAALHGGFLRLLRGQGGGVVLDAAVERIDRVNGSWRAISGNRCFVAPVVVDAAGAWADAVAAMAHVAPVGIQPMRRTACIIDGPPGQDPAWPLLGDVAGTWYCRPEARTKLLVSPADETPVPPHDVQPEELDVATGIANMQQALDVPVRRVEHAWAGLRSFAPDHSLVIGEDPTAPAFFWMAGQGGYGIQTAPAAGRLLADLVLGRPHDRRLAARVSPSRFRP